MGSRIFAFFVSVCFETFLHSPPHIKNDYRNKQQNEGYIENRQYLSIFVKFRDIDRSSCICKIFSNVT